MQDHRQLMPVSIFLRSKILFTFSLALFITVQYKQNHRRLMYVGIFPIANVLFTSHLLIV
jgi:hypothetical protein